MKFINFLLIIAFFLLSADTTFAQAPRTFSYQGMLLDAAKTPVSGLHKITLQLYDAASEGTVLHHESFKSEVDNGIFSVIIGSQVSISPAILFDKQYWLGVSVDGGAEMIPRTMLTSMPYTNSSISSGGRVTPQDVAHSIIGTANQVLADGTSGTQQSGDVTLTLPQNIHTGATPQFVNVNLSGIPSGSSYTDVIVSNGGTLQTRTISSLGTSGVSSAIGTANQINVSSATGDVTFSLPQNIHTGATPQFANINLTGIPNSSSYTDFIVSNGGALQTRSLSSLSGSYWSKTGNSGTVAGTNFIGTTDNVALDFRSNNIIDLRLNPNGSIQRDAGGNTRGAEAVDLQKSRSLITQVASGGFSTISGGLSNTAGGEDATIGGGENNTAAGSHATVGGGTANSASATNSTVSGGYHNYASAGDATVSGGTSDSATASQATVGGGRNNKATGPNSTVGGGLVNLAAGEQSSISGGAGNTIASTAYGSTIGGGGTNTISSGTGSTIAGGGLNTISGDYDFIGGGQGNHAQGGLSAIAGGQYNFAEGLGFVGGGDSNKSSNYNTAIGAGHANFTQAAYSMIGAGHSNHTLENGNDCFIGAGKYNIIAGGGISGFIGAGEKNYVAGTSGAISGGLYNYTASYSAIPGGRNLAIRNNSFGFNGDVSATRTDLALGYTDNLAYFGNVDMWIGNVDNTARGIRFYSPNTDYTYIGGSSYYTRFAARSQSANILYVLTSVQGTANTLLSNDGNGNLAWTLSTATAWGLTGNSGTVAGTNFIGTTDNVALDFRSNNIIDLRLNPNGSIQRDAGGNTRGAEAVDLQKSRTSVTQVASGGFSSISGGAGNTAGGEGAAIGGGVGNAIPGGSANTIAGGLSNLINGSYNTIGGGLSNKILDYAGGVIAGGMDNTAYGNGFIGGGSNNNVSQASVVGGGEYNFARYYGFVGGGLHNTMDDHTDFSLITGGDSNNIGDGIKYSAIAGGRKLQLNSNYSFGFNGDHSTTITNIRDDNNVAYFGNVDLWLGNVDGSARALRFYTPNSAHVYSNVSGHHYTAFKSQAQSANITYILPNAQGAANQLLTNDGSGNLSWSSPSVPAAGWNLGGNASPSSNVFGTTTASDVVMKANGVTVATLKTTGSLDLPPTTSAGAGVLTQNGTRIMHNSAASSFFGTNAGNLTMTGDGNAADGVNALRSNTSGWGNTAIGSGSMIANTSGFVNTAVGYQAYYTNTTGTGNTALGVWALFSNTSGGENVAVGGGSQYSNSSGASNVSTGVYTLHENTIGSGNTSSGDRSLFSNTTGSLNNATGYYTLYSNTTGNENVADGNNSGAANITGSNNTFLGSRSNASSGSLSNATAIGSRAVVGASNSIVLGSINGINSATADTKVGIGTTTPQQRLDVVGNFQFSGALMPNATAGSAGQILTSQGAGVSPTWTSPGEHGVASAVAGTTQVINDANVSATSTIIVTIEGTVTFGAVTARVAGTSFTVTTGVALTATDQINYQILP